MKTSEISGAQNNDFKSIFLEFCEHVGLFYYANRLLLSLVPKLKQDQLINKEAYHLHSSGSYYNDLKFRINPNQNCVGHWSR